MNSGVLLSCSRCIRLRLCPEHSIYWVPKRRWFRTFPVRRKSHYEHLNLQTDCSPKDIKAAYYKLSKQFHPDVNKSADAAKKFQQITEAYDVLSSQSRRLDYDKLLKQSASPKARFSTSKSGKTGAHVDFTARAYESQDLSPEEFEQFRRIWRQNARRTQEPPRGRTKFHDQEHAYRASYTSPGWKERSSAEASRFYETARANARQRLRDEAEWRRREFHMASGRQARGVALIFGTCVFSVALIVAFWEWMFPPRVTAMNMGEKVMGQNPGAREFWADRDVEDPWNLKPKKKPKARKSSDNDGQGVEPWKGENVS